MSTRWPEDLNAGLSGCVVPDGWRLIIEDTDVMLASIDPNYKISHVSEEHGTLNFSFSTALTGVNSTIMTAIASDARAKSARTCGICGNAGTYRGDRYNLRTICALCVDTKEKKTCTTDDDATVTLNGKAQNHSEKEQPHPPESSSRALGDRLRFLRGLQVLTPQEIARRAGISLHALLTLEAGERKPTAIEVLGLAWAFGLAHSEVFSGIK
jgi:hypothetical protein